MCGETLCSLVTLGRNIYAVHWYTCCVDMAIGSTSCPCRQSQTTFGSFAACTLPIAGDFEYIFLDHV